MREVRLFKIDLPNKSSVYTEQRTYRVFLGNETKRSFSNFKDAKAFLSETNRFLTEKLYELNYMYSVVFTEYRKVWFYMSDNHSIRRIEDKVNESFALIDRGFIQAGDRSGTTNGNYFIFNYFSNICENLITVLELIIQVHTHRNYFGDIKTANALKTRIEVIFKEIQAFGKE
jgi:hypothetical protein